jgi:hypothetical protein
VDNTGVRCRDAPSAHMLPPVFHRGKAMAPRREKLTIEIDREMREALNRLASKDDRSVAYTARRMLAAEIARRERKPAPPRRQAA